MNKILFLDDSPQRREVKMASALDDDIITFCETARTCIELLKLNRYNIVSLDHDLGLEVYVSSDRVDSGMEVVRFLEADSVPRKHGKIIVHSWNVPAGTQMKDRLQAAGYNAEYLPFIASSR